MRKSVTQEKEKRSKSKTKVGGETQESTITVQESHNDGAMKATKHVQLFEKEDAAKIEKHHKRDKENKKSKQTRDADTGMEEKGAKECQLTNGDDRKRKKREKSKKKNDRSEMGNAEEVEGLEGDSGSGMTSGRVAATREWKNREAIRSHEDGEIEVEGGNTKKDVMEVGERKKRKREKNKGKDHNGIGLNDPFPEDDSTKNKTADNENDSGIFFGKDQKGDASDKADRKKKKKKKIRKETDGENVTENMEGNMHSTKHDGNALKKLDKKKHKKGKNSKDVSSVGWPDRSTQDSIDGLLHTDEVTDEVESAIKGRKKKTKVVENGSDGIQDEEVKNSKRREKKKAKLVENGLDAATPNKSNKRVRFSGEVEVFSLPDDSNTEMLGNDEEEDNLIRGKRFTSDEDKIIKDSVFKYIEKYHLGDEGLDMVLNSKKHSKLKGCWKEIGLALPHRPCTATYFRAQVIFRRADTRNWTKEELELIKNHQKEHGNEWKALADELGRHRWHVKDAYRRNKLENLKRGHWTQNEYQTLFDLVNTDLLLKVNEEKRSKHGMLRDNICWTAISDKLSTRTQSKCCEKWYNQLTSPMVAEGIWADTDDYRLLSVLYSLDATCMEDVDWDCLLDNRSGDLCRKRWNQMLLHIGHNGKKSFADQVEVLAQRYCPNLLEARETWDSKPRVP